MSIFKSTFPSFVQNQLYARQRVVSQGFVNGENSDRTTPYGFTSRDSNFLRYTTGKNSWVRMSSFVNVNKKIGSVSYSGDALSRKYVLEGGTLASDARAKDAFNLRSGVGKQSSVYGGDIDRGGNRPLGYRPMPGITSISVTNKSAYGSLRESTIKYYCWDKHQLEELELLFMRTGYTVLLEWGWSQYLDSSNLTDITIENINDYRIIDPFSSKLSNDDIIYNKIEDNNKKYHGNYDAMLGYIKNFSWSLMPNGGFDCSTVLISRGEILSTLKVSSNNPNIDLSKSTTSPPPLSLFEQIFLNYTALLNDAEITGDKGQFNTAGDNATDTTSAGFITSQTVLDFVALIQSTAAKHSLRDDGGNNYNLLSNFDSSVNYSGGFLPLSSANDQYGYAIEFVRFDVVVALLNLFYNLKDEAGNIICPILIPKTNQCLACVDSVSIDPTTCLIRNPKAKKIIGQDDTGGGLIFLLKSKILNVDRLNQNQEADVNATDLITPFSDENLDIDKHNFLVSNNRGLIGNIYIAIPKLVEIFRSKSGSGDVTAIDLLTELLNQISRALGGINNFQLHTTKSSAEIIDVKYLEKGGSKFEFDLLGLKSICRDVRIQSRIFESQSTMIGIAAQNTANVGDIYSSTQNKLNEGLLDRVVKDKTLGGGTTTKRKKSSIDLYDADGNVTQKQITYTDGSTETVSATTPTLTASEKSFQSLSGYILYKTSVQNISGIATLPSPEEISNAYSVLKTYYLQKRGFQLGNSAIIPFELEITLDGISGIVVGQVFKVNENILPQSYSDANVGFITTGVSHNLQSNDWTTTIKAQICILNG